MSDVRVSRSFAAAASSIMRRLDVRGSSGSSLRDESMASEIEYKEARLGSLARSLGATKRKLEQQTVCSGEV